MKNNKFSAENVISLSLLCFFLFAVILPVASMFSRVTSESFRAVVRSPQFPVAAKNSLFAALAASLISLSLGMLAAWCVERVEVCGKAFLSAVFTAPMLLPSISHSFGLIALFGANGLVTKAAGLRFNVYGFPGIVAGSVMYSFPLAFLMLSDALRREDALPHQAALVLGVPPFRRFIGLTFPHLSRAALSAFFAVFAMVVTDYGVPLMIGGQRLTLSVMMYNKAAVMGDYGAGSVISGFMLLPAIAAFLSDFLNPARERRDMSAETVAPKGGEVRKRVAELFCGALCILILAPVFAFFVMAFETKYPVNPVPTLFHIKKALNMGAGRYLLHSLLYASLSVALGLPLAFLCAYFTARLKSPFTKILRLCALLPMAVPGIVLGLSYLIHFHNSYLYGTVGIMVLVNSVHFFSSPYLMMCNALEKISPDIESVAAALGVGKCRAVLDLVLPTVTEPLKEMYAYFFVNAMMTISAVSFLAPPAPKPVALMIYQFEAQLLMESAAFVSLLIFGVNFLARLAAQYGKTFPAKNTP